MGRPAGKCTQPDLIFVAADSGTVNPPGRPLLHPLFGHRHKISQELCCS